MQRQDTGGDNHLDPREESHRVTACQMTVVFVSFLPALWLVVAGQFSLAPAAACATCGVLLWTSGCEDGGHQPAASACAFETSARPPNARIGVQSGPDRFSSPDLILSPNPSLPLPTRFFYRPEQPFTLARCWQFDLRAAHEPRAPTSVS